MAQSIQSIQSIETVQIQQIQIQQIQQIQIQLPNHQEIVLQQLYQTTKQTTHHLFAESIDAMRIGQLMGVMVKQVEQATYPTGKIPGADKKAIVLALGRRLLQDPAVIPSDAVRSAASTAYDALAETMLETLLDVSKHVNTVIQQAAVSCCEAVLACLKK